MEKKSIIVIGGGIAGLTAGCYAEKSNFKTEIFEMHNLPGGLCTAWRRKGFNIDCCIHWLVGAGQGSNFYNLWKELGVFINNKKMIFHDHLIEVKDVGGKKLIIYNDLEKLENHLLELAIEDKKSIKDLIKTIKIFQRYDLPIGKPTELYNIIDYIKLFTKYLPVLFMIFKYKNVSMKDYVTKFKNKFLKDNFPKIFDLPNFSIVIFFFHLSWLTKKASGYPEGGSLAFAKDLEKFYKSQNGKMRYNTKVEKIIVEDNKAIGVLTTDGKSHFADVVIYSGDGKALFEKMLDDKYFYDDIKRNYQNLKPFPPILQIALGINIDLSKISHFTLHELNNPIKIAGIDHYNLKIEHSSYDITTTPPGKTLLKVMFFSEYNYWKELYKDLRKYNAEKERVASMIIDEVINIHPEIKDKIDMIDVSTPITYKRYTGNYNGSFEGWLIDTKSIDLKLKKSLHGLKNFYMTGHWVTVGGGIPLVALASRDVIQIICKNEKVKFCIK